MQIGLVFAILAAISYAAAGVFLRRGVYHTGEVTTAVTISVFVGVPFFAIATSIDGGWGQLWSLSGQQVLLLAMAGLVHFIAGRLLSFNAYRLIGANKTSPLLQTTPFYTLILGVILLNEPLTIYLIFGVGSIVTGALLVSTERRSVREAGKVAAGAEVKGILAALGAAIFWGISPILIRPVMQEFGSAPAAALVSYTAASVAMAFYLFNGNHRRQLARIGFSVPLLAIIGSGLLNSLAHLFNFAALGHSPASLVTSLTSTSILFVLIFSFLLNRSIEVFTPRIIMGMAATVAGSFLIFYF
ncbi:MAG: DMT family transporter [Chloroflexi bacterium]|nr:DMT family transporter [Chloroflexota bacterium]